MKTGEEEEEEGGGAIDKSVVSPEEAFSTPGGHARRGSSPEEKEREREREQQGSGGWCKEEGKGECVLVRVVVWEEDIKAVFSGAEGGRLLLLLPAGHPPFARARRS